MTTTNLFLLSKGKVAAINKKDGTIVWQVTLKDYVKTISSHAIGQIQVEGDKLYIGIYGILVCISAKDGSLIWSNELKGWGFQFVTIANATNETNAAILQAAEMAAVAAGGV